VSAPLVRVHDGANELVVLKPAGLASEVTRDPDADSLVRRLRDEGEPTPRLVHRLDAPACGLVLDARSQAAAAHYAREIAARRWAQWYVARVATPSDAAARLVGAHKAYLKTEGRGSRVVRAGGKPSFLDVVLAVATPDDPGHSHVLIHLQTGRLHQIRVMLAHAGAPLAGDGRYGGPDDRAMYLEHVVLGTTQFGTGSWSVWQAPVHESRDAWSSTLCDAVEACAATARTAPPPPDPAP
jgi:23S rRNA pseudouridine1911/1915/1917 synthase